METANHNLESISNNSSYNASEDAGGITAAVLVENGIAYPISVAEYRRLLQSEYIDESNLVQENLPSPRSVTYSFKPTSSSLAWPSAKTKRVSAIYERPSSLSVTETMSFTRSVSQSGGISITAKVLEQIDTAVSANYSYSKSSTSGTSQSVTGTLTPTKNKRYAAVVFTPRLATVKGTLTERIDIMGSTSNTYTCTLVYPVTSSKGYLDGLYAVAEYDSMSQFPGIA